MKSTFASTFPNVPWNWVGSYEWTILSVGSVHTFAYCRNICSYDVIPSWRRLNFKEVWRSSVQTRLSQSVRLSRQWLISMSFHSLFVWLMYCYCVCGCTQGDCVCVCVCVYDHCVSQMALKQIKRSCGGFNSLQPRLLDWESHWVQFGVCGAQHVWHFLHSINTTNNNQTISVFYPYFYYYGVTSEV